MMLKKVLGKLWDVDEGRFLFIVATGTNSTPKKDAGTMSSFGSFQNQEVGIFLHSSWYTFERQCGQEVEKISGRGTITERPGFEFEMNE